MEKNDFKIYSILLHCCRNVTRIERVGERSNVTSAEAPRLRRRAVEEDPQAVLHRAQALVHPRGGAGKEGLILLARQNKSKKTSVAKLSTLLSDLKKKVISQTPCYGGYSLHCPLVEKE